MKETTKIFLRHVVAKTKDISTSLLPERTAERQARGKPLPGNSPTQQKQADHPTPRPATKSKKRHIPFMAFALVLVLSGPCLVSLLGQLPFARAREDLPLSVDRQHSASTSLDNTPLACSQQNNWCQNGPGGNTHPCTVNGVDGWCPSNLDNNGKPIASPTPDCIETNTCYVPGSLASNQLPNGSYGIAERQPCSNFSNFDINYQTLCANGEDFEWGNRDITCVNNPNIQSEIEGISSNTQITSIPETTTSSSTTSVSATSTPSGSNPNSPSPLSGLQNENTCTQNLDDKGNCSLSNHTCSLCYSDNATGADGIDKIIHDEVVGGDNIFCFNQACASATSNTSGTTDNAAVCGIGQPYDKSACSSWPTNNGIFYNPTAYHPGYAVEIGTIGPNSTKVTGPGASAWGDFINGITFGQVSLPTTTNTAYPVCEGGEWTCNNGTNIVMNSTVSHSFVGDPLMVKPNPLMAAFNRGSHFPPLYIITCTNPGNSLDFPCSDLPTGINLENIQRDWLSGDGLVGNVGNNIASNPKAENYPAGHLNTTYNEDTIGNPLLQSLFAIMRASGYVLVIPIVILIGYQMLWASWTYRNVAAMDALGRLILGIMTVGISYQLVTMLIGLTNMFNHAVLMLHQELPYSGIKASTVINTSTTAYTLAGDTDPVSFRGIVVPITRWGCTINIFLGILSNKFATDVAGAVTPFFGGMIQLFGKIKDAAEIFQHIGEFIALLLSINLCVQAYIRVIFINYYVVTAPVVFACWALPGATGKKVVNQWMKGLLSILFTQTVQLFVLTTMPLLVPPFPPLPGGVWGMINVLFEQLPRIIVLMATVQVPKMIGTGATKATAQAGMMAAGATAALASAAFNIV